MISKTLAVVTVCAGLGLLPIPLPEVLPFLSTPDSISGVAHAQYGTSRRVARRTSRRTSQRHAAYYDDVQAVAVPVDVAPVTALPSGCTPVSKGGVTYQQCGTTLYQPAYEGDQLVYVPQ
jgi:hypothetical protein